MKKKIFLLVTVICLTVLMSAGCVESYKQNAVATDWNAVKEVSSNGGMAVRAGNFVYYVNGYAGNEGDNTFGTPLKGAIVRVELKDNVPDPKTNTVIVPKIVYHTGAKAGLYIAGDYIYYSTPNAERDKSGKAKVDEMRLMRTKLDGTDTAVVKKFDSYSADYAVGNGEILYYLNNELHSINLNDKKFADTMVDEKLTACYFTPRKDGENSFAATALYTKSSETETDTHNILYSYRNGEKKAIINGKTSYTVLEHPQGYTLTVVEGIYVGADTLRLVYKKTDRGSYTISKGTYSFDFKSDWKFDAQKEVRYTQDTEYTEMRFLSEDAAVVSTSSDLRLITRNEGVWMTEKIMTNSVSVFKIEEQENVAVLYYIYSNKLYRLPFAEVKTAGDKKTYSLAIVGSAVLFNASYNSSWLQPDLIGDTLYFFNSNVLNYTYTLDLGKVVPRDSDSMTPVLLSKITAEDEISLIKS